MNRPNIAALGLLVAAQTFFLFGLLFSVIPLVKSPLTTIEQTSIFLEPDVPPLFKAVAENMPWLVSFVIFPMFAVPAGFLFLGGFSIWRLIGRRRWLADEREALRQKDMESLYQGLLTEIAEGLARPPRGGSGGVARPEGSTRELLYEGMVKVVPQLDRRRQCRFHGFLHESGLEGERAAPPPAGVPPSRPSFRQRWLLVRAITLGLFLVSAFIALWGLLALVFEPQAQLMNAALGIEFDHVDALMAVAACFNVAAIPLTFGLGLLWLSRLDGKLRGRWNLGLAQARRELLEGYRHQMHTLFQGAGEDRLAVGRALTANAFPELDGPGRRRVLEILSELGLTTDASVLDASFADLSGVDLTAMNLANVCLRGFNLNYALLTGTDLTGANLAGARLYAADLRRAALGGACLRGADLRSARLHSAFLRGADLSSAHLEGANLWHADLAGADLTDCRVDAAQLAAAEPRVSPPDLGTEHA